MTRKGSGRESKGEEGKRKRVESNEEGRIIKNGMKKEWKEMSRFCSW